MRTYITAVFDWIEKSYHRCQLDGKATQNPKTPKPQNPV